MSDRRRYPQFRHTLGELRNSVLGYGGGLAALAMLYVGLFPSFSDMLADFELPESYDAFFGEIDDLSSLAAFIQVEFFSLWLPLLLAIFATVKGTSVLGADEGAGRLELILSQPVTRRRVFVERCGALFAGIVLICAACSAGFALAWPVFVDQADVSLVEVVSANFALVGFGWFFVALALLAGAIAPARAQATAMMTAFIVVGYLSDVLRDLVSGLEPLRFLSPFFYGDTKRLLTEGAVPWHQLVLFVATAISAFLALKAFEAREIGTDRSPLFRRTR